MQDELDATGLCNSGVAGLPGKMAWLAGLCSVLRTVRGSVLLFFFSSAAQVPPFLVCFLLLLFAFFFLGLGCAHKVNGA